MSSPDYGNVPAQPVYGQVQEMEAQVAGAPMPAAEEAALPAATAPEAVAPVAPAVASSPSPGNIVDVLPPSNTAPANTGIAPRRPEEQLALLILGTPGMGSLTRTLAAQIVGRYPAETHIPEEQLDQAGLAALQIQKMTGQGPTTEG